MKNRIRELREQRGLTQEQLGEMVGTSRQAINAIERRFVKTMRPQKVTIQALDENGREIILTGEGEMAKCYCHELEHLDGEIFLDKAVELLH